MSTAIRGVTQARPITSELLAHVRGSHRAVVSATESGRVAGLGLLDPAAAPVPVGEWFVRSIEGQRVAPGEPILEVVGTASELGAAEDYVMGVLGFASGIAQRAAEIASVSPPGLAVVCGGWKKLPAPLKPALRAGLAVAGVRPRLMEGDFVYVPKNTVKLLGGIAAAVLAGRALGHGPVAVQVHDVPTALEAAVHGAGAVMVDTGTLSMLARVHAALAKGGFRDDLVVGFGGGATAAHLVAAREAGADVVDVGRAVLDAPLLDLRMEVQA